MIKEFVKKHLDFIVAFGVSLVAFLFVTIHPMPDLLKLILQILVVYLSDIPTAIFRQLKFDHENKDYYLTSFEKLKIRVLVGWSLIKLHLLGEADSGVTFKGSVALLERLAVGARRELWADKIRADNQVSHMSVDELFEDIESRRNGFNRFLHKHKILFWLVRNLWYRLEDHPEDLHCNIKHCFQRVYRGYSNRDCWCLHYFISTIVVGGCKWLIKHKHGIPMSAFEESDPVDKDGNFTDKAHTRAEKRFNKILEEIIHTFEVAIHISESRWMYQKSEEYDLKLANKYRRINKKLQKEKPKLFRRRELRVMTKKECQRYENGWKLFQEHFFGLSD